MCFTGAKQDDTLSPPSLFKVTEGNKVVKACIMMSILDGSHRVQAICMLALERGEHEWASTNG